MIKMDIKPIVQKKNAEITSILKSNRNPIVMQSFEKSVNGTWDLVASLSDKAPYAALRFEAGAVRRSLDIPNSQCSEQYPVLWGLSTAKISTSLEYDNLRSEISLTGMNMHMYIYMCICIFEHAYIDTLYTSFI
jgi:hypothetical protein